jgi:hypothetical protein
MEIRNRSNGEVTTVSQFKASQPNTSFPKQITTQILDSYGYDAVLNGAQATVTAPYGVSTRSGIEEISGQWFTKFIAGPVFTDIEGGATASEQETEYRTGIDTQVAASVRTQRDKLLAETDWVVTKAKETSTNIPAAMKTYRQELRDISSAEGFPHTMTWPTKPS